MSEVQAASIPADSNRVLTLIGYGLFILGVMNGATAIVGVVLAYVKRDEARGTIWKSHFRNMIHLFWTSVAMMALFAIGATVMFGGIIQTGDTGQLSSWMFALPVMWISGALYLVFYLYRSVKGLLRALENQPYGGTPSARVAPAA